MTKRLHLLLIVIFLLYSSIAFAIQDVNCDTPYDRGNLLCVYTGITAWEPYPPYSQVEGDDNPLDARWGCDPRDTGLPDACCIHCPPTGQIACCEGNIYLGNGRSVMSYALASAPRGFDTPSLNHLNTKDKLKCG